MKFWLLRPIDGLNNENNPWEPWYDKAFGFVVRAETETKARKFAHTNAGDENRDAGTANTKQPWKDAEYSTCVELSLNGEEGIILRDFAAA